jgi:hypothetical protein
MSQPIRIQRKRTKGWKMPENTVYVGRPTLWGNLWQAGGMVNEMVSNEWGHETPSWFGRKAGEIICDAADAVDMYRKWIPDCARRNVPLPFHELRGKNLACWCALNKPCHADVLLELANSPADRDGK